MAEAEVAPPSRRLGVAVAYARLQLTTKRLGAFGRRRPALAICACGRFAGRAVADGADLHISLIRAPDLPAVPGVRAGKVWQRSFDALARPAYEIAVHFTQPPALGRPDDDDPPAAGLLTPPEPALEDAGVAAALGLAAPPAGGVTIAAGALVLTGIPVCQVSGPLAARIGALIGVVVVVTVMT